MGHRPAMNHKTTDPADSSLTIRSGGRTRLSPEARQEQLLGSAVACYARMGVERAGHGDVAKHAGVSTATVFNYFATREALTDAVLGRVKQVVDDVFDADDADAKTNPVHGRPKLLSLAMRFGAVIDDYPNVVRVLLNWSVSFGDERRPDYLAFQDDVLNQIHAAMSTKPRDGHAGERAEARIIYGAATSFAMMKLDNSAPETLAKFISRVADIFPAEI